MMIPRLRRRHLAGAALAAATVLSVGLIVWGVASRPPLPPVSVTLDLPPPSPTPSSATGSETPEWAELLGRKLQRPLVDPQAVAAAAAEEQDEEPAEPPEPPPPPRPAVQVLGIYFAPSNPLAVVRAPGQNARTIVSVGDELAGGRIAAIEREQLVLEVQNATFTYSVARANNR